MKCKKGGGCTADDVVSMLMNTLTSYRPFNNIHANESLKFNIHIVSNSNHSTKHAILRTHTHTKEHIQRFWEFSPKFCLIHYSNVFT